MDRAEGLARAEEAPGGPAAPAGPEQDELRQRVIEALCSVYDPEIPVSLYELGLIYRLDIDPDGVVDIDMTLTAPGCPVAGEMPLQVQDAVETVEGVSRANVTLVFDPPWDPSLMSEDARLALGMI